MLLVLVLVAAVLLLAASIWSTRATTCASRASLCCTATVVAAWQSLSTTRSNTAHSASEVAAQGLDHVRPQWLCLCPDFGWRGTCCARP